MSKVILYIAASIDGYIAKKDGNIDWLNAYPNPNNDDYGYSDLLSRISTTIMGRTTYDEVLSFGVEWPYPDKKSYVITHYTDFKPTTPNTEVYQGDLNSLISEIRLNTQKDIWLIGGGKLITQFLNEGLIDEMILTVIPIMLGDGIPLFLKSSKETNWKLQNAKAYDSGFVNLTYVK
jgi:dihydrofolate reductase